MMSNINSFARARLNDKSPFLLFITLFGKEIPAAFQIFRIDADDINLSPSCFQINNIKKIAKIFYIE